MITKPHLTAFSLLAGEVLSLALAFFILSAAVLWWLTLEARKKTRKSPGRRKVTYPRAAGNLVRAGWVAVVLLPALAAAQGVIQGTESIILTACFLTALVLPLHLEVRGFEITWDGYWIYTKSFWRKRRRIPANSVTRCDYYHSLQSYLILTRKNGLIRVPIYAKGIPELLALLPVAVPAYPPPLFRKKEQPLG